MARRSGTSSMAVTRCPHHQRRADGKLATGPQPQMVTVSPGWICAFSAAM
jgi:hypothetical protein